MYITLRARARMNIGDIKRWRVKGLYSEFAEYLDSATKCMFHGTGSTKGND